jgi:hypothetical protein
MICAGLFLLADDEIRGGDVLRTDKDVGMVAAGVRYGKGSEGGHIRVNADLLDRYCLPLSIAKISKLVLNRLQGLLHNYTDPTRQLQETGRLVQSPNSCRLWECAQVQPYSPRCHHHC